MARSVNKAIIIGNLTADPELRYTPQGHAVATFRVATNRSWISNGEEKEEAEFHPVVAWDKLAEICSQLLQKGTRVYVEGRLQTRRWQGKDGQERQRTEIVSEEMVVLERKKPAAGEAEGYVVEEKVPEVPAEEPPVEVPEGEVEEGKKKGKKAEAEEVPASDIPF